jgi:hypothetical protein
VIVLAFFAAAAERVHLNPKFRPGDTVYYRIEMHTISTGKTTTPIVNPEGGTKFAENVDLLVRLDVLSATPESADPARAHARRQDAGTPVRMRVTYVHARADSQSDAPEFDTPSPSKQYDHLQGRSFEFTLEPGGTPTDFEGLADIFPNSSNEAPALSWIKSLSSARGLPRKGIAIGQKWTSEKPLAGAPLTGLVWRAESTYLRDEPCASSAPPAGGTHHPAGRCAVILTRFQIMQHGSPHSDETPLDYVRHGLRTSGVWTGSGESLDSIALGTGLLANSTQTSTQHVDFDITSAANGEKIHRVGKVQTQTIITRVAAPEPETQP